ncbi:MAG: serine/threonine protein kinase [Coriobacteriia bacterium]|nr:serine/threonine protein kinase [Coriobacteriia bacterium]
MLRYGTVIEDKYEILTLVGEGGMSYVYLARDIRLNKQWAVKEIKQTGDRVHDEMIAQSFVTEANLMKRVDHPMLPRIVDILNYQGMILVVMDYIEGQSLSKILEDVGAQSQNDVVEWGLQLCEALHYLHTQSPPIIYRDMKPANIILRPDGNIRIVDFGTAREYRDVPFGYVAGDTTILGTRGYAAPEQFGGAGQTDVRTDIYSLGATLYHLLTGLSPADPPYEMIPIRQVKPNLSPGLEKVIAKCIQPNPDMRYQNSAELFYALQNFEHNDDAYFVRQKRKMASFIFSACLSVVMLVSSLGFSIANNVMVKRTVEYHMERARIASDPLVAEHEYIEAIELVPDYFPAYIELVDLYKVDGEFTIREEQSFQALMSLHSNDIRDGSMESAQLNYRVGILYLYYYTYDNTESTSMLLRCSYARDWFLYSMNISAFSGQERSRLLFRVCDDFLRVHDQEDRTLLTNADYRDIFFDMQEVTKLVANEDDITRLWVSGIVLNIHYQCHHNFQIAGISTRQQVELISRTAVLLDSTNPPTNEYLELKQSSKQLLTYLQEFYSLSSYRQYGMVLCLGPGAGIKGTF